jgi:hypothetical protein
MKHGLLRAVWLGRLREGLSSWWWKHSTRLGRRRVLLLLLLLLLLRIIWLRRLWRDLGDRKLLALLLLSRSLPVEVLLSSVAIVSIQ